MTIILNQCIIFGATNIKRLSDKTEFRSMGDKKYGIGCDIQLNDFRVNVNFDAKLGFPKYRLHPTLKTCCISIRSCILFTEFLIDLKQKSIKLNKLRIVSKDRIKCVSTGFVWPFNRTVETLIRKNIELFINENQSELELRAKLLIDQLFEPNFNDLEFAINGFKTIVNSLKV